MEPRTAEIILCLKGNHSLDKKYVRPQLGAYYDIVAMYMGDQCDIAPQRYTKSDIASIVRIAVLDYISSCDNPAEFLRDYFNTCDIYNRVNDSIYLDDCQLWCATLANIKVRDGKTYKWVNGFNDSLAHQLFDYNKI